MNGKNKILFPCTLIYSQKGTFNHPNGRGSKSIRSFRESF